MSYTLVVVDMQDKFPASNGPTIVSNCQREISKAIRDGAGIIFLEYSGYPATKKEIFDLVDGYNLARSTVKCCDDGSLEAQNVINEHNLNKDYIKVCGVNTDYCVRSTVEGLRELYPFAFIEVIADACDSSWDHSTGLLNIKNIPNVLVRENSL